MSIQLNPAGPSGPEGTTVNLRSYQHASRIFVDANYRLSPKYGFLYYVEFDFNPSITSISNRTAQELGMIVKSVSLPKYQMETKTLNAYNRVNLVQTKVKYEPITIKFHDDNMGVVNQLWQNYYGYYYADSMSAWVDGAYNRTAMQNSNYIPTNYGLDNGSTNPFFSYIKIYQMARHEYVQYTLHNPIITQWNHNKVAYSETGTHDNNMEISYEAVSYDTGNVTAGKPEGFGSEHYDQTPSPLLNSASTGTGPTFTQQPNVTNVANTVSTQINSYQNTSVLPIAGTAGLSSILQTATSSIGGLSNIAFPVVGSTTNNVTAKLVNL